MDTVQRQPSDGKNEFREKPQGVVGLHPEIHRVIPTALRSERRWVLWKYEIRDGKPTKVPMRSNGLGQADSTLAETWAPIEDCLATIAREPAQKFGLGFVLGDGWAGIDFDHGMAVDGTLGKETATLLEMLCGVGCWVERSPSGVGLKAIMRLEDTALVRDSVQASTAKRGATGGKIAPNRPGLKELEFYWSGRYFTVTGHALDRPEWKGEQFTDASEAFVKIVASGNAMKFRSGKGPSPTQGPPIRLVRDLSDEDVLALAFKAKNGSQVRAIYDGSDEIHGGDTSAADCALAGHLAFYCGPNGHDQVARIMRASGRNREKFDREDYMASTIAMAYAGRTEFYDPARKRTEPRADAPKPKSDSGVSLDELHIARQFRDAHHGRIVWTDQDVFLWLDQASGVLARDSVGATLSLAMDFVTGTLDDCVDCERQRAKLSKVQVASAVLRGARAYPLNSGGLAVKHEDLDINAWLLGTPSGLIDLRTGSQRVGTVHDLVSKSTRVSPADRADESTCPNWLAFLRSTVKGDAETMRYLQRHAGYCLTGDLSEHAFVIVTGPGGTGKSTYIEMLAYTLGDYAVTMSAEVLMDEGTNHPTHVASLAGARLAIASEFPEGKPLNEARLKRLTGNDTIRARFMRQDEFTFPMQAKIMAATNHRPRLRETGDAMARRLNVVEFNHKPEKPDSMLRAKLEREAPGILRWMLDGLAELLQNRQRLDGHGLQPPACVVGATAAYLADEDSMGEWWDESFQFLAHTHRAEQNFVSSAELLASWKEWAESNGVAMRVDTKKMAEFVHLKLGIGSPVRGRGLDGTRTRGFYGIVRAPKMLDSEGCSD